MRIFFLIVLILFHRYDLYSNDKVNVNRTIAIESFKRLPVQHEGRIKPMDTLARNSLLMLHGSQSLRHQGKSLNSIEWLLDVLMNSKSSKVLKLIRIENSDLLGMIGKDPKSRGYYSIQDLEPYFKDIYNQSSQVLMIDENLRDTFQQAVVVLWKQIATYLSLSNTLWIAGIKNERGRGLRFVRFEKIVK